MQKGEPTLNFVYSIPFIEVAYLFKQLQCKEAKE